MKKEIKIIMSEFTDGIELMRQSALERIAEAESLEDAALMIKNTKFFFTPDEGDIADDT